MSEDDFQTVTVFIDDEDVDSEPRLFITDDKGEDHEVGKPKLIGLNYTEWWALQEIMDHQECWYESHGFGGAFTTTVTTPGGDKYELDEFMEVLTSVRKLKIKKKTK